MWLQLLALAHALAAAIAQCSNEYKSPSNCAPRENAAPGSTSACDYEMYYTVVPDAQKVDIKVVSAIDTSSWGDEGFWTGISLNADSNKMPNGLPYLITIPNKAAAESNTGFTVKAFTKINGYSPPTATGDNLMTSGMVKDNTLSFNFSRTLSTAELEGTKCYYIQYVVKGGAVTAAGGLKPHTGKPHNPTQMLCFSNCTGGAGTGATTSSEETQEEETQTENGQAATGQGQQETSTSQTQETQENNQEKEENEATTKDPNNGSGTPRFGISALLATMAGLLLR